VLDAARSLDLAEEAQRLHAERPSTAPAPAAESRAGRGWLRARMLGATVVGIAGLTTAALEQAVLGVGLLAIAIAIGTWAWLDSRASRLAGADVRAAADLERQLEADSAARRMRLHEATRQAEDGLRAALAARGAGSVGDLRAAVGAYEAACAEREDLVRTAAAAEGLRRAIEARSAAEEGAARAEQAAAAIETALREAALRIGDSADGPPESLAAALAAWQAQRGEVARASEIAIREWQELQGLLAGETLAELQGQAADRARAAAALATAAGIHLALPIGVDPGEAMNAARGEASRAKEVVDALNGELRLLAGTMPDVVEAEERADAARTELARVQDLAAVIDETLSLLQTAERRVHRDLAPILTESVQRHLPAITGGAYVEVGMNPRDLSVDVKEASTGQWRDARLLSEGTREQIYLLLRVAMAEHLVTTRGERAPLLLDEVTAQADPERKRRMLDVLHALSADRQVILFSHDDEVVAWAAESLREPRDRLIRLVAPASRPLVEAASL
jgi:DNA repair protein SbcC/Rad50